MIDKSIITLFEEIIKKKNGKKKMKILEVLKIKQE